MLEPLWNLTMVCRLAGVDALFVIVPFPFVSTSSTWLFVSSPFCFSGVLGGSRGVSIVLVV